MHPRRNNWRYLINYLETNNNVLVVHLTYIYIYIYKKNSQHGLP